MAKTTKLLKLVTIKMRMENIKLNCKYSLQEVLSLMFNSMFFVVICESNFTTKSENSFKGYHTPTCFSLIQNITRTAQNCFCKNVLTTLQKLMFLVSAFLIIQSNYRNILKSNAFI